MVEVDDSISVIGDHGVIEDQSANAMPVLERAALPQTRSMRRAFVSYIDVESQSALGLRISFVEDLRHNLVPKVKGFTRDPWLVGRDQQPHKLRRTRRLPLWLTELGDLVELPDRGFAVSQSQDQTSQKEDWYLAPSASHRRIRGIAQLRIIDELRMITADVLLSNKVCGVQRREVLR